MTDNFPTGTALISVLIDLHCETDNEDVVELIELEIVTEGLGLVSVALPDEKPVPNATVETLTDLHEQFVRRDKGIGRYVRLRVFDEMGAFEECRSDRDGSSSDVFTELTDDELRYLWSVDDSQIQMLIEDEVTHRGLSEDGE